MHVCTELFRREFSLESVLFSLMRKQYTHRPLLAVVKVHGALVNNGLYARTVQYNTDSVQSDTALDQICF